jgi:hypothetical protein
MASTTKKYEKKIREIQNLKKKQNLNDSEIDKIKKESYFKELLNKNRNTTTIYNDLPNELRLYIMEYLDTNTRLNLLRKKYTIEFIKNKLSYLPSKEVSSIKKLYLCFKYIENILVKYLDKNSDIYNRIRFYIDYKHIKPIINYQYFLENDGSNDWWFSKKILIELILIGIKHFSKMYKRTNNATEINENEKSMIKMFITLQNKF